MWIRITLLLIVAVGVGFFGYSQWEAQRNRLPDHIAFGNGQIEAVQVDIAAKTGGRVAEVLVREGDMVMPGDLLVQMDKRQLEAQLARAEADIARAESDVAASVAMVAQAEALLIFAQQELVRAEELVERRVMSQEQLDSRISEARVAEATFTSAQANETAARRTVDAAVAQLQEITTQIEDSQLVSTVQGRVLYRLAEPGEVIGSGATALVVVDLSDVYMEFFLPSTEAHQIAIGSEARIVLDIFEDLAAPATVSFVSPESQFTPRSVEVRDERDNLMFRVRVRVPQALVEARIERVLTGIRGVAYVKLEGGEELPWPEQLVPPAEIIDLLNAPVAESG
ncbi:MAG: efflux RND transporter periplasmic adaptor subunit [Pseudomonadota bacterium]